jgi:hypothetical protein
MKQNMNFWSVKYELQQMSKYLDLIENTITQRMEDIEKAFQEDMKRLMSEEEEGHMDAHYTDQFIEASEDFPQLLLTGFVVTWYSFVEQQLMQFCERLKLQITIEFTDTLYLKKGIWRAYQFLNKARGYSIDNTHWNDLCQVNKLRNFLVHENRRIPWTLSKPEGDFVENTSELSRGDTGEAIPIYIRADEKLVTYLKKNDMLVISGMSFKIIPSLAYCHSLVELSDKLFSRLYADLYAE